MTHLLSGTLPLVMTSDVSPAGNYSVRIVANNVAEDTVSYIISDSAEPTGSYYTNVLRVMAALYSHRIRWKTIRTVV